ncbi:MAG: redoxin family protein [Actinobacteria bacterium]|uniref:Unannotated protein n=1 Tax=freshwater metagenome TaxID=449393 RepID=A0A6J6YB71_9ZZZZ|nr:redoxin family protein [Actinomycetota bacterium]MSW76697.1 redoxin family protein [Actinomycetota bacterium]MSX56071.1 redoxin family protein [Actinomycetota bacterium]MSX92210.1 redoxin family protein [Actinomycetota bacterium]MSZ82144.1 redoxin family protein [Actinomycetota bacterium]
MANRQRAEARRKAQAKAAHQPGGGGNSRGVMWIAIAVVVVVAAGIAIFAASGDDAKSTAPVTSDSVSGSNLPDTQPVTVTGAALPAFDNAAAPDPAVGTLAPVLAGKDFQGDAVTIDGTKGGPYMVVFLAHWCPHCNREVPLLLDWKATGGVPASLHVVGVATAVSPSSANYPPADWFSNKGWSWPVMVDQSQGEGVAGSAAQAFGASGWPYFVIVGADGKVKFRGSGEITIDELQRVVDAAIAA